MTSPVEKIIAGLGKKTKPLLNSDLAELSNLNSEEMEALKAVWTALVPERRERIVERLVELAEDNLELNFDAIFRFCLEDADEEVRSRAIEGLWENEEASLIAPLIDLLEKDTSEKVQAEAAIALGKFALLAEHNKLRSSHVEKIQEALLAAIADDSKAVEVSRRALESAAPVSIPRVQKAIGEAYKSRNPVLKVSSIYAMGRSCDPVWMPVLLRELASEDAEMRYEAAGACGELEEEEAVPYLVEVASEDSDVDVRVAAVQALGKIGGITAKECLKQCLESVSEAVRQAAEQALNEVAIAEDPLSFGLDDKG
jgi:HEAT repeat protein